MQHKKKWTETQQRFEAWWDRSHIDRPLMLVVAKNKTPTEELEPEKPFETTEAMYLDAEERSKRYRNYIRTHTFMADAYPNFSMDIGPGSMALYLGSEPIFAEDTVWFKECVEDWKKFGPLRFDESNRWWKTHLDIIQQAKGQANGDYIVNIPDIIENVDILAAMRGPQQLIFDLVDESEMMKEYINQIDSLYFTYYNEMYERVKLEDGSSSFTAFKVWGPGKTAKVQCDFCALMSPDQFRQFVQPSLQKQCAQLDQSVYHLDGPDAIKHLDALMEIEELDALQWTCGAGQPDGANDRWLPIYDTVKKAGKSLWIDISDGEFDDWVAGADRLIKRYGPDGIYFLFPDMTLPQAEQLIEKAERDWSSP